MKRAADLAVLLGFVVVSQLAGAIGGAFTASSVGTWYAALNKPSFNPPNWLFAPVWTTLYVSMGVAAWLVWRSQGDRRRVRTAMWLFGIQLVLNALWSIIFFGLRDPMWAWFELLALWCAILATSDYFYGISRAAGLLLLPYLTWVTFAGILNYYLWRLNS